MRETLLKNELHKVEREILIHGLTYNIIRTETDKYGEPIEDKTITNISGLFHISKGYVTKNISDGTRTHSKGQPKLLVIYEDAKQLLIGDIVMINNKKYKIIELNNLQEMNIITDISLEVTLNGNI